MSETNYHNYGAPVDLSKASLEKMCADLFVMRSKGRNISLKPNKLIMVKYSNETTQEWLDRCQRAREIVARLAIPLECKEAG